MNQNQKKEIQLLTAQYVGKSKSQAQAAASLKNVSEATLINIKNNKWDSISDEMWRNVGKQVGWNDRRSNMVETRNLSTLLYYYGLAKEYGETFAITGPEGSGKSYAGKWYAQTMRGQNVWYLECHALLNKKYFLHELLEAMGKSAAGLNAYEMMKLIVMELRKQDKPLIILDEVDKLDDKVLQFFITLYNQLHGLCGIVWTSTDAISVRIKRRMDKKTIGFGEIFSRIGRRFIELPGLNKQEMRAICEANDMTEEEDINRFWNESEGDIRRVDRGSIQVAEKKKRKNAA